MICNIIKDISFISTQLKDSIPNIAIFDVMFEGEYPFEKDNFHPHTTVFLADTYWSTFLFIAYL